MGLLLRTFSPQRRPLVPNAQWLLARLYVLAEARANEKSWDPRGIRWTCLLEGLCEVLGANCDEMAQALYAAPDALTLSIQRSDRSRLCGVEDRTAAEIIRAGIEL